MIKKFIGDRAFYKRLILLMLPIMIQNGITNFVNMLDNVMIGSVGTAEMTGVSISNQLLFVFNLCIFGAVSGAGIFGAQFFGNRDYEGVKHTFRFKLIFGTLLTVLGILLFFFCGEWIIGLYMRGEQNTANAQATLGFGYDYLKVMLIGLVPFALVQCYSSTYREAGKPTLPMVAGVVAVFVNLALNYVLIFGHFGAPKLGVVGAAIATVISRFVELFVVIIATHRRNSKAHFFKGVYKSLYVPRILAGKLFIKGLPLMINETMWAAGIAAINQSYSNYGLSPVSAGNISQTFWNVFSIAYLSVGVAIGIILGQMLGENRLSEAKADSYKMVAFSFAVASFFALLYGICAKFIPLAYNTEPEIRTLATQMMQISAIAMPFDAIAHASYFTLRSGGKMFITFIFDCGSMWLINVLLAFILSNFTTIPFLVLYALMQGISGLKGIFGLLLVRNGFWVKNIIS